MALQNKEEFAGSVEEKIAVSSIVLNSWDAIINRKKWQQEEQTDLACYKYFGKKNQKI